jgi:hypothetical protein
MILMTGGDPIPVDWVDGALSEEYFAGVPATYIWVDGELVWTHPDWCECDGCLWFG